MRKIHFITIIASAVCVASCGSSSSSSGITNLTTLPKATGAVSTSSTSSLMKAAATTGVKLKSWSDVTWGSGTSRAMCQSGVISKNVLRESARPDKILCYMGVMESASLFTSPYDGTDQYYSLNPGSASLKVKFNITKAASGEITNFKMWTCEGGDSQTAYMSVANSSGSITMKSVQIQTNSGFSFSNSCSVTGNHDGTAWTSKTMTVSQRGTGGSSDTAFDESNYAQIVQSSTSNTLSGFRTGTYGGSTNFEETVYAVMQTLNTDKLSTYAIGDGSAKFSASYGGVSVDGTVSWNGDTEARVTPASSGDYYTTAAAGTLPTAAAQTISFGTGETWDCAAASSFTSISDANMETVQTALSACDEKFGGDSHRDWIDCHGGAGN